MNVFLSLDPDASRKSWVKRLTLFSRLMIGYLTVLILVIAVSVYAILKLHEFNNGMRHILRVDYFILDYQKKLSDSILAQFRYDKKYFVTKDARFYDQFLSEKEACNRFLATVSAAADTPEKKGSLEKIKRAYADYHALVDKEVIYVRTRQNYHRKWFELEKEKAVNVILNELQTLVVHSQKDIQDRMGMLGEFRSTARGFAMIMSTLAILLAVAAAFFFSRGIAKPLSALVEKTKEISDGTFEGNLVIASPPEISELAKAFNLMCDRLKEVDRMKSDFFSSMSHELRTPLTSIKEGITLLQDGVGGATTDKQKKLLAILTVESNRLINLVNSLLDLSKMEAGMVNYIFRQERVEPLIERVTLEMAPLLEAKKISLQTKLSEERPLIHMDRERMLQVLRNLIGNAVKFTHEGGRVIVSTRLINSEIEVSVADTGPGIPKENLAAIFEKFHQVPLKASGGIKGTGLGLAIVKHVVAAHGGSVWAESQVGQGSAFIFRLPAV